MSDHAAIVRKAHADAMMALAADVHPYTQSSIDAHEQAMDAALDALVAERDESIACLQRVVEADRDDSRMGHPNAGDSCIGICIGLDVMPWLDQRGKLLPFAALAAPTKEEG